jgi:hypothetical protein
MPSHRGPAAGRYYARGVRVRNRLILESLWGWAFPRSEDVPYSRIHAGAA